MSARDWNQWNPDHSPEELLARFSRRIERQESGCWRWTASLDGGGYGRLHFAGPRRAHVWSHMLFIGPVPDGHVVDHLCRNRACVNPDHLEAVTQAENVRRGAASGGLLWERSPVCRRGHPFPVNGTCRPCRNEDNRRYRARLKEAA